ncbi:hypothetical protein RhiirC2_864396, partial [Rhizophagus irregularis]
MRLRLIKKFPKLILNSGFLMADLSSTNDLASLSMFLTEWDYNYEDNSIRLRSNRKFVLDVARQEDATPLILYEDLCGPNQKFTLQKWNYTSGAENVDKLVTNIMDNYKFLPKLSQNLLEILNDDEYYDVTIEVGNDPNVKIFRAHMIILNCRS